MHRQLPSHRSAILRAHMTAQQVLTGCGSFSAGGAACLAAPVRLRGETGESTPPPPLPTPL